MRRTAAGVAVFGVLLAGWTVLRAQAPGTPGAPDIMPALLEEVRGLRAALEQMSSAGARVQLALGRLQLQEARMNTSIKRLDDVRTRLTEALKQQAELQRRFTGLEDALKGSSRGATPSGNNDGPPREELEHMHKVLRWELATATTEVQRLTAEESTYATDVANEQARWIEFNQRLEDLERTLRPLK